MRKATLLLTLLAAAGAPACVREPSGDQPIDRVLDEYTPGLRLGETVSEARRKLRGLYFPPGGSANYADTVSSSTDGFSNIVLRFDVAAFDSPPPETAEIERIEVWASGAPDAAQRALQRITGALNKAPTSGCDRSSAGTPSVRVHYWVVGKQGVALEQPLTGANWSAKLTFFEGRWDPERILAARFTTECPGS